MSKGKYGLQEKEMSCILKSFRGEEEGMEVDYAHFVDY